MRKKALTALPAVAMAMLMTGTLAFSACNPGEEKEPLTDSAPTGATLADFTDGKAETFFASDGWTNGSVFNAWWSAEQVTYSEGAAHLGIAENAEGSAADNNGYYAGELRSYQYFGYGDYEVTMKPSRKTGTASTFFVCTGPYDTDEEGNENPWDEIDIEFLGQDTTKVQFNYYVDGVGGHEYMYNLGFDASETYHKYGFRWTAEYIVWFVDGVPVYKVEKAEDTPMPSTPGRILMNYWSGTPEAEGWMGVFTDPDDTTSDYKKITTSATPIGTLPEKVEVEEFEGDWTAIAALEPDFVSSNGKHNVVKSGSSTQITYSEVTGNEYSNAYALIADDAADKNWVHAVLKNNSAVLTTAVRINLVTADPVRIINSFAYGNGELLTTSSEGTFVTLEPGAEIELEIKFTGVANAFELMLDSARGTSATYEGDVTVSDLKFAKQGDIVIPDEPESVNNGVTVNGENVKFGGNVGGDLYIINTDNETNSMNVTYAKISGASYQNISADVASIAVGKTEFSVKVKNNGTEAVTVRIDVRGTSNDGKTDACNVSATQDGVGVYTDTEWGGSTFTVAAGGESLLSVVYTSNGVHGTASSVMFYIDSSVYDDKATHSGDITFSEMNFGGQEEVKPYEPETPDVPDGENCSLSFTSTEQFTVKQSGVASESVDVTYDQITGGSYQNIQANVAALAADHDRFSLKIKNNGDTAVVVRVDLIGENTFGNTDVCNLSHQSTGGTAGRTDTEWGGTYITVAAGEELTLIIQYDGAGDRGAVQRVQLYFDTATYGDKGTYSGNLTVSEFRFTKSDAE